MLQRKSPKTATVANDDEKKISEHSEELSDSLKEESEDIMPKIDV